MLKEKLDTMISEAMKSKNTLSLKVLRDIKLNFSKYEHGDKKSGRQEIDDATELKILLKMKAQYEDTLQQFTAAGSEIHTLAARQDLDELLSYIPAQPTDEEIAEFAKEAIDVFCHDANRKVEMRDMKTILSMVQERYPTASGAIVSKVVKSYIQ